VVWQVDEGISQPLGLALAKDGTTYVVDFRDGVINRIAPNGKLLVPWGSPGSGNGRLAAAAGIAIDAKGSIYVADHDNYRIEKFSADGTFVATWGSRGDAPGSFDGPDGIAVDARGQVWVTEDANSRIQVFDADGGLRQVITATADLKFGDPTGIAFANDAVYVADFEANKIWVLSTAGVLKSTIGSAGTADREFDGLSFMATDADGSLFVTDYGNGRVQQFAPDGTFVKAILFGPGKPFSRPYGVAVGPDGDLYVSEFGASRVERMHTH